MVEHQAIMKISNDLPMTLQPENVVRVETPSDSGEDIDDPKDKTVMSDEMSDEENTTPRNRYEYPQFVSTIRRNRMSFITGFQVSSSYLLDLRNQAPPEIQAWLDLHFLSPTKMKNMDKRYGLKRSEEHLKSGYGQRFALGVDGKKSDVRQQHGRLLQQDKQVIIGKNIQ